MVSPLGPLLTIPKQAAPLLQSLPYHGYSCVALVTLWNGLIYLFVDSPSPRQPREIKDVVSSK